MIVRRLHAIRTLSWGVSLFLAGCSVDSDTPLQAQPGETTNELVAWLPGGDEPAVGATIRYTPIDADSAIALDTTDQDGVFEAPDVAEGTYRVFFRLHDDDTLVALQDSVLIARDTSQLRSDTLEYPVTLVGSVVLQPNHTHWHSSVTLEALGTSSIVNADSSGTFAIPYVPTGRVVVHARVPHQDYGELYETVAVPPDSSRLDIGALTLPFTGVPVVTGVHAVFDAGHGIVCVHWDAVRRPDVDRYVVYRSAVGNAQPNFMPIAWTADTVFFDSVYACNPDTMQHHIADSQTYRYEYRVAVLLVEDMQEGPLWRGASVSVLSPLYGNEPAVSWWACDSLHGKLRFPQSYATRPGNAVLLVADSTTYLAVAEPLEAYRQDIANRFEVAPVLLAGRWEDASQLRHAIKHVYARYGIGGVVLIGNVPLASWEYLGDQFTLSFFYEDMDGAFDDTDADGAYDYHSWGDSPGPELWVALMRPYNGTIGELRELFSKAAGYYRGTPPIENEALLCVQSGYTPGTENRAADVARYYDGAVVELGGLDTNGVARSVTLGDFLDTFTAKPRAIFDFLGPQRRDAIVLDSGGTFRADSMLTLREDGAVINWFWAGASADFSPDARNSAAAMITSGTAAQAVIAPARNIGTERHEEMLRYLNDGGYLGRAYFQWLSDYTNPQFIEQRFPMDDINQFMWAWTLVGNPFVALPGR